MKILTINGSSRKEGNTVSLVNHIMRDIEHTSIHLADYHIKPITDMRHTEEGFPIIDDDYEEILKELLDHDIILFATPIYWFGMSGQMKVFIDRWSQYLRDERFNMKEELKKKKAYVAILGGSDPVIKGLPLIQQFGHIFEFVGMTFSDYMIGNAVRPGEIEQDTVVLEKAKQWNRLFQNL